MALLQPSWSDDAACHGADARLFFSPEAGELKEARLQRERTAKEMCRRCRVRELCLDDALSRHESYGIWGGYTEQERRGLRRR
jgi:WhiB family redox-sensing transcriptional regulator